MQFKILSVYLEKLEKTASRNTITEILADLFNHTDSPEIDKVVYLVLGQLAPGYEGIVLQLADKMMLRVIAKAYGVEIEKVKKLYKERGDIGTAGESLAIRAQSISKAWPNINLVELSKRKTAFIKDDLCESQGSSLKQLAIGEVHEKLLDIAKEGGEGSQERKVELMADLLANLDPLSVRYVARIPLGKLRLGFSDKTIIDALSWMVKGDKSISGKIEKAYQVLPDCGLLAKNIKNLGWEKATSKVVPVAGIPVFPMLAQRIKSPVEMIKKMGTVAVEPKLDGLRLQIHFRRGGRGGIGGKGGIGITKAYTRNLNETSRMFPELTTIGDQLNAKEAIFDCEAVGLDEKTLEMANFQTTMTRRRKHEITETTTLVGITFNLFDILLKDGKNLMDKTYLERRKVLTEVVKEGKVVKVVESEITDKPERIDELYQEKLKAGFEGIMIKKVKSGYVPGRTGWRWVKMKQMEASVGKLTDTVDAVVMGYTLGKGKRTDFGLGQFLVGVRSGDKFVTLTKVGTGLTDEEFRELRWNLEKIKVAEKPKEYEAHKNYTPDYWVVPSFVVELAGDDLTVSPTHTSGYALRFPRLVKFRGDKSAGEATTQKEVKRMFKLQKK